MLCEKISCWNLYFEDLGIMKKQLMFSKNIYRNVYDLDIVPFIDEATLVQRKATNSEKIRNMCESLRNKINQNSELKQICDNEWWFYQDSS